MATLDDITEKIRSAMEAQGTYTPELALCRVLYGVPDCSI